MMKQSLHNLLRGHILERQFLSRDTGVRGTGQDKANRNPVPYGKFNEPLKCGLIVQGEIIEVRCHMASACNCMCAGATYHQSHTPQGASCRMRKIFEHIPDSPSIPVYRYRCDGRFSVDYLPVC